MILNKQRLNAVIKIRSAREGHMAKGKQNENAASRNGGSFVIPKVEEVIFNNCFLS